MAIKADFIPTLRILLGPVAAGGRIITFGRQTVQHPDFPDQESLFGALGFEEVHSLDTSDYEGATHLHDLNAPTPPAELVGRYRVVFTGGTLEHVFEFTNALRTAVALLEPGGWIIHLGPANGWVDHGFYQFSPTLFFDWLTANGFELGHSLARIPAADAATSAVAPLYPGEGGALSSVRGRVVHLLSARKLDASTSDRTPLQGLYAVQYGQGRSRYRFRATGPYIAAGAGIEPLPLRRFPLSGFVPWRSGGYAAPFHREDLLPSAEKRPFRSKALVYEDGRLLDWIVSSPDIVSGRNGSFTHFGRRVHLTASDGSDPRTNGRTYEIAFPIGDVPRPPI